MKTKPKKTKANSVRKDLDHYGHVIISLMKRVNALENQRPAEDQPGEAWKRHTMFLNCYQRGLGVIEVFVSHSRQHADQVQDRQHPRIACLEINFTEGEGL